MKIKSLYKICMSLCMAGMYALASVAVALEVGDSMPNIVGKTLDNKQMSLKYEPKKKRLINVIWVECRPCREEIPMLAQAEKAYPEVGFYIVHAAVAQDKKNYPMSALRHFISGLPAVPQNILMLSSVYVERLEMIAYPKTFVVDEDNRIIHIENRELNRSTIDRMLTTY